MLRDDRSAKVRASDQKDLPHLLQLLQRVLIKAGSLEVVLGVGDNPVDDGGVHIALQRTVSVALSGSRPECHAGCAKRTITWFDILTNG